MKRLWETVLLAFAMACLVLGVQAEGAETVWPPAYKQEASDLGDKNIVIVLNHAYNIDGEYLEIHGEPVKNARLTMISGDESYENAFAVKPRPAGKYLQYNALKVKTEGEAVYRLDLESEHFWASQQMNARFVSFEDIRAVLKQEKLNCTVGETIEVSAIPGQMFSVEPGIDGSQVGAAFLANRVESGYRIDGSTFTALQEGDYQVKLGLAFGANCAMDYSYQITVHIISAEEANALWDASWPPEGKEEGSTYSYFQKRISGEYVYRSGTGTVLITGTPLFPKDSQNDSLRENALRARVTQTAGDDCFQNVFTMEVVYEYYRYYLIFNHDAVTKEGEATYRIDLESEHYWASVEFTAKFISAENVSVTLLDDTIRCTAGETINGGEGCSDQYVRIEPAVAYSYTDFRTSDGEGEKETDLYTVNWNTLTVRKEGSFPIILCVRVGRSSVEYRFPVTVVAQSYEASQAEWDASWPPKEKKEGRAAYISGESVSGQYVYHSGEAIPINWGTVLCPKNSTETRMEKAIRGKVTQTAGDQCFKDAFRIRRIDDYQLTYFQDAVPKDGEASYRVDLESEHYWASVEFTAQFVGTEHVSVTLLNDTVICTAGETVTTGWSCSDRYVTIEPALGKCKVFFETPDGKENGETDQYTCKWGALTIIKEGSFPMILCVQLGENGEIRRFPVTVSAQSAEAAQAEWAASWPPAGKIEGRKSNRNDHSSWNAVYFIHGDESKLSGLAPFFLVSKDGKGTEEEITEYHVTFLSGDEQFRKFLYQGDYDDESVSINLNWDGITAAGTPEYRIDMISEHYWASEIARPRIVDANTVSAELICSVVNVPVGKESDISSLFSERTFVKVEPEYEYTCGLYTPDQEWSAETGWTADNDDYTLNYHFLAKRAGDFPMELRVWIGNGLTRVFPITVHASEKITEAYIEGDAPKSARAVRQEEERAVAEKESVLAGMDPGDQDIETENAVFIVAEDRSGKLTVKKILPKQSDLIIPAALDGKAVKQIGSGSYVFENSGRKTVQSVKIEEGIETIGNYSFGMMELLTDVRLPESLKSIGSNAFRKCPALKTVHFPTGLQKQNIGRCAFDSIGTDELVLPDGTDLMAASLEAFRKEDRYADGMILSTHQDPFDYLVREDGGVVLIGYSAYSEMTVVVPKEINGRPVKEIGIGAFEDNDRIRKAELPEGLEKIDRKAFAGCEFLEEIVIPSTVSEIGAMAFSNVAMEEIALPESAVDVAPNWFLGPARTDGTGKWTYHLMTDQSAVISGYAFEKKVVFPSEVDGHPVTAIMKGNGNRDGKDVVEVIVLPDSLKAVEEEAFSYMSRLSKVTWPANLERIGDSAFRNTCLKKVTFPRTLVSIGREAFYLNELTSAVFSEGLQTIGDRAFYGNRIRELVLPASLNSVGNAAFCPNGDGTVEKVTFLGFRTEIGKGVFGYTSAAGDNRNSPENWLDNYAAGAARNVRTIITLTCYPGSTADLMYQKNVTKKHLSWGEEGKRTAPADRVLNAGLYDPDDLIFELTIPEGVEEIAEGALKDMKSLTRVTVPSTLKKIGAHAFENCTALSNITLPEGITEIPDYAFAQCTSLARVELPKDGILRIGANAFLRCVNLAELKWGNHLAEIGDFAFAGSGLRKAKLPDTVLLLGKNAFAATKLTSLTLPKGLTEIPDELCYNAAELAKVTIPKSVTRIGKSAFRFCPLSSLTLPEGLVTIDGNAFMQDRNAVEHYYSNTRGKKTYGALKSLKLPASLETIGENAFAYNDSLTTVTFAKGSRLKEIGAGAFSVCLKLKELKLPDSLEKIGECAFINCLSLKKADLGAGLITLENGAFKYNGQMTSLTVPDTLTNIGDSLLDGHGEKLTVICGEGSAMETWLKKNEPGVKTARPKKKK